MKVGPTVPQESRGVVCPEAVKIPLFSILEDLLLCPIVASVIDSIDRFPIMICFQGGSKMGTYDQKEETFHTEEEVENNGIDCTLPGIYDCMLQRSLAGLFLIGEKKKARSGKKDLKVKKSCG